MHPGPATLETVRHLLQVARLAIFVGFILVGIRVACAVGATRRRAINHLLAYMLAVQTVVALVQNEAWPFTMYPMMAVAAMDRATPHEVLSFRVVDQMEQEWPVDPLAWSPLFPHSIVAWFVLAYPRATPDERRSVMRFLLQRAERARAWHARGQRFYGNRAILGALAAPDTDLYAPAPQSPKPLFALRVYRVVWNPVDLAGNGRIISRTLVCEYRP